MDFRFRAAVEQARKSDDLYFAALLSKDRITRSLREAGAWFQGWVYTGAVTAWVFLSQCLSSDHFVPGSCCQAGGMASEERPGILLSRHKCVLYRARGVPSALASGNQSAKPEDRDADGPFAVQRTASRSQ